MRRLTIVLSLFLVAVFAAPGVGPRLKPGAPAATIPVAVTGTHDVYVVFRDDNAPPPAALMVVTGIRFVFH